MTERTDSFREFQEQLAVMRQSYLARLPERIEQIAQAWHSRPDEELARMAHNLAGSGKTFGLPAVTEAARTLETLLVSIAEVPDKPSSAQEAQLQTLLDGLRQAAADPAQDSVRQSAHAYVPSELQNEMLAPLDLPAWPRQIDRVMLLSSGPAPDGLVEQLSHFGYAVEVHATPEAVLHAISITSPAALLLQVEEAERPAIAALLTRLRESRATPLPAVFLSGQDDLESRLWAVSVGGDAYFTTPLEIAALAGKLQLLTAHRASEPLLLGQPAPDAFRVLIVEDDEALAHLYAFVLQQAGMRPTVVTDASRILTTLRQTMPDLILMDILLPGYNGLELAHVIRQQEAFVGVPIVFLSADTDARHQMAEMRLGGDTFLPKPLEPDHLIAAVAAGAQRSRTLRSLMVHDVLTGLFNHTSFREHLETEIARAVRHRTPLAVALLDVDHFYRINEEHGTVVGDRVLQSAARLLTRQLRRTDIIARYGGNAFAIVLPEAGAAEAAGVLERIRQHFGQVRHGGASEFHATCSGGFVVLPATGASNVISSNAGEDDGDENQVSISHLLRTADAALARAKSDGRNRLISATI